MMRWIYVLMLIDYQMIFPIQTYLFLSQYLSQNKSVLFVSFRKTIESKYKLDLSALGIDFAYYLDVSKALRNVRDSPKLITQVNSLHHVKGTYDLLILDECTYTIDIVFEFCPKECCPCSTFMRYAFESVGSSGSKSKYVVA
eukprot:22578_1